MKPTDVIVVSNEAMKTVMRGHLAAIRSDHTRIRILVVAAPTHRRRLDGHKGSILVHPDAWSGMSRDVVAALTGWAMYGAKPRAAAKPLPI